MSLLNRRTLLLALPLLAAACGFSPVYAPGGTGSALYGRIEVQAPEEIKGATGTNAYFLVQNLEQRLGRGVLALVVVERREIVEASGHIGVVGA